jgi:hypothetical protein
MTETTTAPPTIKVLGESDEPMGEMTSTTYRVEVDGVQYLWERWCTHNSSGEEWYNVAGEHIAEQNLPFDTSEVGDGFEEVLSAYFTAYDAEASRLGLADLVEQCRVAGQAAAETAGQAWLDEMREEARLT